jgi:MoxR-like ATPase
MGVIVAENNEKKMTKEILAIIADSRYDPVTSGYSDWWPIEEIEKEIQRILKVKNQVRLKIVLDALVVAEVVEYNLGETEVRLVKKATAHTSTSSSSQTDTYNRECELKRQAAEWEAKWTSAQTTIRQREDSLAVSRNALDALAKRHSATQDELLKIKAEREATSGRILKVEVSKTQDGVVTTREITGVFHTQFERILTLAKAREEVFIYGATGCGKTHICEQVASALDLPFYMVSCTAGMSEGILTGRLLPLGKAGKFEYVMSEFVNAFENGGLFLLDEFDAMDANTCLTINAALSNGRMTLSNRPDASVALRHPDFVCLAAVNTWGTGGDRLHAGRNKLDLATLDRFSVGKVTMAYDNVLEELLAKAQCEEYGVEYDETYLKTLWKYRKAIDNHRLERAISTRFIRKAYKMTSGFGWTMKDVETALFQWLERR